MKRHAALLVFGAVFVIVLLVALAAASSMFLGGSTPIVAADKVAVVKIEGVILDAEDVVEQLKKYSENDSVKAIVLRIDSPGGAVVPSQEIYKEVNKLREKTGQVVVTSMGSVAASGGYYIASASDSIMANPGTLTGSIGVIMEFATAKELMSKIGVKGEVVKSGDMKDVGNFMREMTPEERAYLQGVIDDVHDQFVNAVASGRDMPSEEVRKLADGSIFTGRQALEAGLVDELGDFEDAIALAGRLGNIEGEPKVITEKKSQGLLDLLRGEDIGGLLRKSLSSRLPGLMYLYAGPAPM